MQDAPTSIIARYKAPTYPVWLRVYALVSLALFLVLMFVAMPLAVVLAVANALVAAAYRLNWI